MASIYQARQVERKTAELRAAVNLARKLNSMAVQDVQEAATANAKWAAHHISEAKRRFTLARWWIERARIWRD